MKGKVNPSGKLPVSYPVKYSDTPAAPDFPGIPKDNPLNTYYNEGIYVGYRYYETMQVPVSYEFGYGLSYTQFEYGNLKISSGEFEDKLTVSVDVKNTGKMAGKRNRTVVFVGSGMRYGQTGHGAERICQDRFAGTGPDGNGPF